MRLILFLILIATVACAENGMTAAPFYSGFRASRILSSYPNNQFPPPAYWIRAGKEISAKFPGSTPAGIWIVSLYQSNGVTRLNFPSGGGSIPNLQFSASENNETYLTQFDTAGIKVWLQVEPGAADMDTMISLVMNRYKHHSCVIGFGVDVEWFFANTNSGGRKLTDSMVMRWDRKVRSIDSTYTLFIKHYGQSWMPPTYRGSVLFVDDSQDFTFSANPFTAMVSEFKSWGAKFSPANSAFQFGYKADSVWWRPMDDPMKTIGDALRSNIPTCAGVFWVDFTIARIFPITSAQDQTLVPKATMLYPVYPNPFNPTAVITFSVAPRYSASDVGPMGERVTVEIIDICGRNVATIVDEQKLPGIFSVQWNATRYASGVYFVKLHSGGNVLVQKMLLMK